MIPWHASAEWIVQFHIVLCPMDEKGKAGVLKPKRCKDRHHIEGRMSRSFLQARFRIAQCAFHIVFTHRCISHQRQNFAGRIGIELFAFGAAQSMKTGKRFVDLSEIDLDLRFQKGDLNKPRIRSEFKDACRSAGPDRS